MANVKQQLETPSLPPLGYPPEVYDRRNLNENNGALNIFARKLTSVLGSLFGPRGGKFMNNPHGAFQGDLVDDYGKRRLSFLMDLPHWPTFGKGWSRRIAEVGKVGADMA